LANASIIVFPDDLFTIGLLRFVTGFFLAGIYPVGMKIAADWFPQKLGNALGFLVGALVLGTAFPHLLKSQLYSLPWKQVLILTSLLAFSGGLLVLLLIPAKLHAVKSKFQPTAFLLVFKSPSFRSAAFGYFGHMWELYTFWAFIPLILQIYNDLQPSQLSASFWSFVIIAVGCLGCISGGILSKTWGSKKVAFVSLAISGVCCILAPFLFSLPAFLFLIFLLIWGFTVVSDSPQFSSLVAQAAAHQYKGTALTIVTSVGFAITIASIQLMKDVFNNGPKSLWLLAIGPLLGLMALRSTRKSSACISAGRMENY
jgi:MFS family permease